MLEVGRLVWVLGQSVSRLGSRTRSRMCSRSVRQQVLQGRPRTKRCVRFQTRTHERREEKRIRYLGAQDLGWRHRRLAAAGHVHAVGAPLPLERAAPNGLPTGGQGVQGLEQVA